MAIIQKIPTVSNRLHPLAAATAGSVILLCVVATAAILGWLPGRSPSPYSPQPSASKADPALRPVSAPMVKQPRATSAAQRTAST